ncbi:MAG: DNA polymerase domain-containing protein [Candidatus Gagatemarchaeaceae archaeon]
MRGWILDAYPGDPGEMVVWLKREDGQAVRLVDHWSPSIFIATDQMSDLSAPLRIVGADLAWTRTAQKRERVTDAEKSEVVEARVRDARKAQQIAGRIERLGPFGAYRLYNADVPPNQSYLYERDIFPLACCEVTQTGDTLEWDPKDDVWAYDYTVPNLRKVKVDVEIEKEGKLARFTDRIAAISLQSDAGRITIDGGSEADKLLELVRTIKETDPDFVITNDGDTFLLPYLVRRAEANRIADRLTLDRDGAVLRVPSKGGTSYFSYGRIHYKPSAMKLYGRIHIDANTSFTYSEAGLEGLFELSRTCRMPLQTSSRASIGKALSSLQFYHAYRTDLLVPWKPTLVEHFKDRNELLVADRGGFIFEPKMGVHEGVGELDFHALYPNIMFRKNISAETVKCRCCPDSKNRVPELGWNVCERRTGLVPTAIKIIVEKRLHYKELKRNSKGTDYDRYNARQAALKWLGVTTFGYLGFNNAKFGRIDAHIAVCAWDRKVLLDAARLAERRGFEVIHGIVDSLWVRKERAGRDAYLELKSEIESETGFAMSFEGIYKWVTFLPSKVDADVPVLNRYFGAYQDGELKVRGIEARRHDTPLALKKCQMEILRVLAKADSKREVRTKTSECVNIFLRHAEALERHETPASELAFTTNLSKGPEEYTTMTVQHAAINQLVGEGVQLHAGEGIRYVVTDYGGRDSKRATPVDILKDESAYDSKRYIELLAETCSSVLEPFDPRLSAEGLHSLYEAHRSVPLV